MIAEESGESDWLSTHCGNCGKETEDLTFAWWDDGAPWCTECVRASRPRFPELEILTNSDLMTGATFGTEVEDELI